MSITWGEPNVLSREEVDESSLKFHERCVDVYNLLSQIPVYKKCHRFFFMANEKCRGTKTDMCDYLAWCKHSTVTHESAIDGSVVAKIPDLKHMRVGVLRTLFLNGFLFVQPITNADKCSVSIVNGPNTVQVRIIRLNNFKGPILVGASVNVPHLCMECKKLKSDTCKLRFCSRCYKVDHIRVFYCSKECQRKDYPRHSNVCKVDWFDKNWREDQTVLDDYQE